MTIFIASNNASTTLAGAITAGATTCALAPGTGSQFPNPTAGQQFALTFVDAATGLNNEVVYVTARSGDTITTMVRAQEGTTAKAWLAGDLANNFYTQGQDAAKAQIPGVQNNTYTYAADTGSANAYAVALSPAPSLQQGAIIGFTAAHANTTAATLAVNGGTAYPIWGSAHSALQGGEIALNGYVEVEYNPTLNGGNPVYLLLECTGGALQIAPATQSQHAVQLGQATGRLLRTTIYAIVSGSQQVSVNGAAYTTTGATTFNPASSLTTSVEVELVGGGGGGGGVGAPTTSQSSGAAPGSAGGYARKRILSGFSGITVTVGGPGAGGAVGANNGTGGGTTSFGAIVSATGGTGGAGFGGTSAFTALIGPGSGGSGSGGDINGNGGVGSVTQLGGTSSNQVITGVGGQSFFGEGGFNVPNTSGVAAASPGSGGSGIANAGSGGAVALAGGAGAGGIVIVREYA